MSYVPPYHPSQPEPNIAPFEISSIPDEDIDKPTFIIPTKGDGDEFPPLVLGVATFGYGIYADDSTLKSDMPLRVVRVALRSGIRAFDTSPYYHPSEIILGNALRALSLPIEEGGEGLKRNEYKVITKVGKFGSNCKDHIYSKELVEKSIERSLKRFNTDYLDVVYLHDPEYALPGPSIIGNPLSSLSSVLSDDTPPSESELKILEGIKTLRSLQSLGKVHHVGIAGYPLPILLRLALLAQKDDPQGRGLDVVQSFSHHTLQNTSLSHGYLQALNKEAKVNQVISAAPLSMGLLTPTQGPDWHPARSHPELIGTTKQVVEMCQSQNDNIVDVALRFGYRPFYQEDGKKVPVVVGCTDLKQVHSTLQEWKQVNSGGVDDSSKGKELENQVQELFEKQGVKNLSWAVPSEQQRAA